MFEVAAVETEQSEDSIEVGDSFLGCSNAVLPCTVEEGVLTLGEVVDFD